MSAWSGPECHSARAGDPEGGLSFDSRADFAIPNAWWYRDWVARAFNANLPYDEFVREQIAGDLLVEPRLDPAPLGDVDRAGHHMRLTDVHGRVIREIPA